MAKVVSNINLKYCPKCEEMKLVKSFRGGYCLECSRLYFRDYRHTYYLKKKRELKEKLIKKFGGRCKVCGETNINYLLLIPTEGRGQFAFMEELERNQELRAEVVCKNHMEGLASK